MPIRQARPTEDVTHRRYVRVIWHSRNGYEYLFLEPVSFSLLVFTQVHDVSPVGELVGYHLLCKFDFQGDEYHNLSEKLDESWNVARTVNQMPC